MPSIYDWSTTAGTNASADGDINWSEGQLPSTVNDSARVMMKRIAEWVKDNGALTLTGTDTLTVTANSAFTAYATGRQVIAKVANTNTSTTVTLNVNGIGAKRVKVVGSAGEADPEIGSIRAGQWAIFNYDAAANSAAGAWILLNPLQSATLTGAQPLDADLTAIAALSSAANKVPYATGAQAWALADFTTTGRALVAATVTADQILYGNGSNTVTTASLTSTGRALIASSITTDQILYGNGAGTVTTATLTSFGRDLIDSADASAARTSLALSTAATTSIGTSGATLPLLDGNNTYSGTATFTGSRVETQGIFSIGPAVLHTISSGAITLTASHVTLAGQGGTTDDFDQINGGSAGDIVIIRNSQSAYTITVRDIGVSGGNIELDGATAFAMNNARDTLTLMYNGTLWLEVGRANNG